MLREDTIMHDPYMTSKPISHCIWMKLIADQAPGHKHCTERTSRDLSDCTDCLDSLAGIEFSAGTHQKTRECEEFLLMLLGDPLECTGQQRGVGGCFLEDTVVTGSNCGSIRGRS